MDRARDVGEDDAPETKKCANCKKEIRVVNYQIHELHCRRHLTVCNKCGDSVPISALQKHDEENHAQVLCDLCSTTVEQSELEDHQENDCQRRPVLCPFCDLKYPLSDFIEHESACGSRTDQCERCLKIVMLRLMARHLGSECRGFATDQAGPSHGWADQHKVAIHSAQRHPRPHLLPKVSNMEANKISNHIRHGKGSAATTKRSQNLAPIKKSATQPIDPRTATSDTGSEDEGILLPCEFCHFPMKMEQLIIHQTACAEGQEFDVPGDSLPRARAGHIGFPAHLGGYESPPDVTPHDNGGGDSPRRQLGEENIYPPFRGRGSISPPRPFMQGLIGQNSSFNPQDTLANRTQDTLANRTQEDGNDEYVNCSHCDFPIIIGEIFDHEVACRIQNFGTVYGPIEDLTLKVQQINQPTAPSFSPADERFQSMSLRDQNTPHASRDTQLSEEYNPSLRYGHEHNSQLQQGYGAYNPESTRNRETLRPSSPLSADPFTSPPFSHPTPLAGSPEAPDSHRNRDPYGGLSQRHDFSTTRNEPLGGSPRRGYSGGDFSNDSDERSDDGGEEMMVRCEFCTEEYPLNLLMRHEECCQRNPQRLVIADPYSSTSATTPGGNEPPGGLSSSHLEDLSDDPFRPQSSIAEAVPCEFCSAVYPFDVVQQHQAICSKNSHWTEDMRSPPTDQELMGYSAITSGKKHDLFKRPAVRDVPSGTPATRTSTSRSPASRGPTGRTSTSRSPAARTSATITSTGRSAAGEEPTSRTSIIRSPASEAPSSRSRRSRSPRTQIPVNKTSRYYGGNYKWLSSTSPEDRDETGMGQTMSTYSSKSVDSRPKAFVNRSGIGGLSHTPSRPSPIKGQQATNGIRTPTSLTRHVRETGSRARMRQPLPAITVSSGSLPHGSQARSQQSSNICSQRSRGLEGVYTASNGTINKK